MHLKNSKGSKQSEHLYSALQAVAPNLLTKDVFSELHLGQIIVSDGGAIPYFLSFSLVSALIQSVVQAGE